jgi:hypothetical protein
MNKAGREMESGHPRQHLPDENLTQLAGQLVVEVFLGIGQLQVHVAINGLGIATRN